MFDNVRIQQLIPSGPVRLARPTTAQLVAIHAICEEFESSSAAGESLTIEHAVSDSPESLRPYLLESLVRSELELLKDLGNDVDPKAYLERFEQDREIVVRAFVPVEELEHWDSSGQWLKHPNTERESHPDPITPHDGIHRTPLPKQLGPFEIIGEIASGGMGVIYRGRHHELKRDVAVKCIRSGQFANDSEIQRFRNEAQTVAALKHDGIVPIYEFGTEGGLLYFAMPLIDGVDLGVHITGGPLGHQEIARIVRDAAIATQFAHECDIVHRDLKPRNILLDHQQKVWVTDFGLAKGTPKRNILEPVPHDEQDLTWPGELIGTPSYMAPEQLQGRATALSDVYSLGAVLYAGLTGRPPHQAATLIQTLKNLSESEPVAPRLLDPQIPRDLEKITLKALQRTPGSRYSSAQMLAEDIERFLNGRPVLAKATSSVEHVWRWMKREPALASLSLGFVFALAVGLIVSLWFYTMAAKSERIASFNANLAVSSVEQYLTNVADSPELREEGLEDLRRNLLRSAVGFYEQLAQQSPSNARLDERTAQANFRLGLLQADLGKIDQAINQFDKVIVNQRQSQFPRSSVPLQRLIVEALEQRSLLQKQIGDRSIAVAGYTEAIEACRTLVKQNDDFTNRTLLISLMTQIGEEYAELGKSREEASSFEDAILVLEELVHSTETDVSARDLRRMVRGVDRLGLNLQKRARFDEAEKWLKLGLEFFNSQNSESSNDPDSRFIVARIHKNLNQVYATTQRMERAKLEFEAADKLLGKLQAEHPLVLDYLDIRAALLANRGVQLVLQDDFASAEIVLNETIQLQEQVVAKQPTAFGNYNNLCNMYNSLGAALSNQRKYQEAEKAFRRGIDVHARGRELAPDRVSVDFFGLNLQSGLASTLVAQGKFAAAFDTLKDVTPAIQQLAEQSASSPQYRVTAIGALKSTATCKFMLGQTDSAILDAQQAIEGYEGLPPPLQRAWTVTRIATDAGLTLARCQLQANRLSEANHEVQRVLTWVAPILSDTELSSFRISLFRGTRGEAYFLLGSIHAAKQKNVEASEYLGKAVEDQAFVVESFAGLPTENSLPARRALAGYYVGLARVMFDLNKKNEAIDACESAIRLQTEEQAEAESLLIELKVATPKS